MSTFIAKEHILPDGHIGDQRKFLMNNNDTFFLTVLDLVEFADLTIIDDIAFIRSVRINTAQYIHKCGLSCAVLTHQGVNFTRVESQINTIQGLDAREFNRNAFHYDDGVFICHVFALNENEMLSFCDI